MSKKYVFIGVEGYHDQAFVGRVLKKIFGLEKFDGSLENMNDELWKSFIPTYPKSGNLYKRLDMPYIYFKDDISIAIYAGGGTELSQNLKDILLNKRLNFLFYAILIIADADNQSADQVEQKYKQELQELSDNQDLWDQKSQPFAGLRIYILPNNVDTGVLETLLLKCGKIAYPTHLEEAEKYITNISTLENIKWKNFNQEKAIIATVASVLKPGGTNTVSIEDNKWVSEITYQQVEDLRKLVIFLKDSLGIEPIITVEK